MSKRHLHGRAGRRTRSSQNGNNHTVTTSVSLFEKFNGTVRDLTINGNGVLDIVCKSKNAVKTGVSGKLTVEDIPEEIRTPARESASFRADLTLEETEKAKILAVLESCQGNKSRAAEQLGISRRTLHRKINEWGLK